ncbi:MAG: hypothetical protein E3K37_05340 [Candidatus Kuenenia sp.]|nr:hypothetical protein [Candidatus Kuenenia hertensis]
MGEKNKSTPGGQSKKSASGEKSSAKKSRVVKEKTPELNLSKSPLPDKTSPSAISSMINTLLAEIEKNPLKLVDKEKRESVFKSYEKLIRILIKEINSARL